ncbi:MAG: 6-bladed beta-propeller [Candidatus Eisenbacteria sp.]|nr:6-bladed beta-propeller [Candidatus Eisenbacteria bacterium]
MAANRLLRPYIAVMLLVLLACTCAKEKPESPRRLNPLDPATELEEPDPFHLVAELEGDAVSVNWQAAAIGGIAGWMLLRSEDALFDQPDTLASFDLDLRSYLDTGVAPSLTYYYKVLAVDGSGMVSAGSHLVAARIETRPVIQIDGGAEYAASRRVTLVFLTAEADSMWIANDSAFAAAQGQPFQSPVTDWLLESGAGVKTVYLQLRHADGRMSPTVVDSILPLPIADRWILGESGTRYLTSPTGRIVVHATGADSLKTWNSGDPVPGEWVPFPSTSDSLPLDWSFPGGEGWKTLMVRFKDDFLIETMTDTVSLAVDLSPPVARFTVTPPESGRYFVVDATASHDVLDVTPAEDLLFSWQWEDEESWTTWSTERTGTHTYETFGPKTIRVIVKDAVGREDTLSYDVEALNRAPSLPGNPTPADGAAGQSILPTLSWTASVDEDGDPVTYTVYFGDGPGPDQVLADNLPDPVHPAPPLADGRTYYWNVVATDTLGLGSDPVQWSFTTHTRSGDVYSPIISWGSPGAGPGQMEVVRDVVVDSRGRIYVSDINNGRIQIFSYPGIYLDEITEAAGAGLEQPCGLAVDEDASLYVADTNNHRVVKFDSTGQWVRSIGTRGTGDGEFEFPRDVCVDSGGNIYVLDTGNNRVQKFDASGHFTLEWGSMGDLDGQFQTPGGLAETQGSIYVADSFNKRIQQFDNQGQFLASWGGFGGDSVPGAVAADSQGNVYVLERSGAIHKFTADGALLSSWGAGDLGSPVDGLCVGAAGHLVWVADTFNHRVQVFERQ